MVHWVPFLTLVMPDMWVMPSFYILASLLIHHHVASSLSHLCQIYLSMVVGLRHGLGMCLEGRRSYTHSTAFSHSQPYLALHPSAALSLPTFSQFCAGLHSHTSWTAELVAMTYATRTAAPWVPALLRAASACQRHLDSNLTAPGAEVLA